MKMLFGVLIVDRSGDGTSCGAEYRRVQGFAPYDLQLSGVRPVHELVISKGKDAQFEQRWGFAHSPGETVDSWGVKL
jgi:hypothetical protein